MWSPLHERDLFCLLSLGNEVVVDSKMLRSIDHLHVLEDGLLLLIAEWFHT